MLQNKKLKNTNFQHLANVSTSIFFTNFPITTKSEDILTLCRRHGSVADVYIAKKLSKSGRRFGFVRYLNVKNIKDLLEDLNRIWIGNHHLYATLAHFDRNHKPQSENQNPNLKQAPIFNNHENHSSIKGSYVSALKGIIPDVKAQNSNLHQQSITTILKSVSIDESDLWNESNSSCIVLAKVRDINLIDNIFKVLSKEGFLDFKAKYMGGLWLWLNFENESAASNFMSHKEIKWYFTSVKPYSKSFVVDERLVWIDILGLPLEACTKNAFKKVAANWGEALLVDEDDVDCITIGRVCIKKRTKGTIEEDCKVSIRGQDFKIHVKEYAAWSPEFESLPSDDDNDSDSENSLPCEPDENMISDDEEGEFIPETEINNGPK